MRKRILITAVAVLFVAGLSLAGSADKKEGSWTGWVTDSHCGAKGDNAKHANCATKCVKEMGAKYVLYTPADKKVYELDPQDKAAGHAGHHVKVTGTVDEGKIKVASIEMTGEQKGQDKPKN